MPERENKPGIPDVFRELEASGWTIEFEQEEAGTIHPPHCHETTHLFTLRGGMRIRVDEGKWVEQGPGDLFVVEDGQLHEAVVGIDGWEYFAAVKPDVSTE